MRLRPIEQLSFTVRLVLEQRAAQRSLYFVLARDGLYQPGKWAMRTMPPISSTICSTAMNVLAVRASWNSSVSTVTTAE